MYMYYPILYQPMLYHILSLFKCRHQSRINWNKKKLILLTSISKFNQWLQRFSIEYLTGYQALTFNLEQALKTDSYPVWIMKGTTASWAFFLTSPLRSSRHVSRWGIHSLNSEGRGLWLGNFSLSQPSSWKTEPM